MAEVGRERKKGNERGMVNIWSVSSSKMDVGGYVSRVCLF